MIAELNGKSIFTFVPRLLFQHLYLGIIYNKISPLKKKNAVKSFIRKKASGEKEQTHQKIINALKQKGII